MSATASESAGSSPSSLSSGVLTPSSNLEPGVSQPASQARIDFSSLPIQEEEEFADIGDPTAMKSETARDLEAIMRESIASQEVSADSRLETGPAAKAAAEIPSSSAPVASTTVELRRKIHP